MKRLVNIYAYSVDEYTEEEELLVNRISDYFDTQGQIVIYIDLLDDGRVKVCYWDPKKDPEDGMPDYEEMIWRE